MKKFLREFIIIVLFIAAILLVLALLFYDYFPKEKDIAKIEQYEVSAEIEEELSQTPELDESTITQPYEVGSGDLKKYQTEAKYVPGKVNPFAMDTTTEETVEEEKDGSGNPTEEESKTPSTNITVPSVDTSGQNKK